MKKQVILSFDYELFFGKNSGTVEKTLITPTNYLLNCMDDIGAKGTFFIDCLMLKSLQRVHSPRTDADLLSIETQLYDIIKRGHRIELHLHPHWLDAKYNNDGTWDFSDFTHYSLMNLDLNTIESLFQDGCKTLESFARTIIPDYKVITFRAGGWAVDPISHIKPFLKRAGIKIDSSAISGFGYQFLNNGCDLNFSGIPSKPMYRVGNRSTIEDSQSDIVEIPISTYRRNVFDKIIDKATKVTSSAKYKVITDGSHYRPGQDSSRKWLGIFNTMKSSPTMFSLSRITPLRIRKSLLKYTKDLVVFIDHPKDFSMSNLDVLNSMKEISTFITFKDYFETKQR